MNLDSRVSKCGDFPANSTISSNKSIIKYENSGVISERSSSGKNPYEACFWEIKNPIIPDTLDERAFIEIVIPSIKDADVYIFKGT